jgi:hypothetical protein
MIISTFLLFSSYRDHHGNGAILICIHQLSAHESCNLYEFEAVFSTIKDVVSCHDVIDGTSPSFVTNINGVYHCEIVTGLTLSSIIGRVKNIFVGSIVRTFELVGATPNILLSITDHDFGVIS